MGRNLDLWSKDNFRLSVETRDCGAVNLHFLISPDDPNQVHEAFASSH